MKSEPYVMIGGVAVDDRGSLAFCNEFDFESVKRFYTVQNHSVGFVRAWHAHKEEAKYVTVIKGAAIIGVVKIVGGFEDPSKAESVERFVLSASCPSVVYLPAGYANGARTLTDDAILMYYSTKTLEESGGDDYRYPVNYWGLVWEVKER